MSTEQTTSSEGDSGRPRPIDLTLNIPSVVIENVTDEDRERSPSLLCTPSPSHTPRNKSPVTVQEWVDSLPLTPVDSERAEDEALSEDHIDIVINPEADDTLTLGAEASLMCGANPPAVQVTSCCREPSETGSICSSVESLLEARKPDPEEILLGLGFGGPSYAADTGRVPQRFLQPSKLKGVAIDDFLKQQHEMVETFESGFCGYRGLTGPSHTMPSVIVAKIMEKLRKHERGNSSIASPPRASDPKNNNSDKNKFSRVARNVLTKIRCVPGSVLTPDNRKWLDSQGDKSPEISRKRIIIGQQSFTFGRDGDLIESQSPTSSLTDSDRWTSSTSGLMKPQESAELKQSHFPSILEDSPDHVDSTPSSPKEQSVLPCLPNKASFANIVTSLLAEKNDDSKLSASSSFEVSDEDKHWTTSVGDSGLPSSGRSSRGLDDCESPVNVPQISAEVEEIISTKEDCDTVPKVLISNDKLVQDIKDRTSTEIEHSDSVVSSNLVHSDNKNKEREILTTTPVQCSSSSDNNSCPSSEMSSTLLVSSPWPSLPDIKMDSLSDDDLSVMNSESLKANEQIVNIGDNLESRDMSVSDDSLNKLLVPPRAKVIESIDKVIESLEKIKEPLEAFAGTSSQRNMEVVCYDKEKLQQQYQDLCLLSNQLANGGVYLEIGTESQFLSLTHNEKCALQCRIVRQALCAYHSQLANDEIHFELKTCLGTEVQKLEDLLDLSSDSDKLSTVVTQITLLLKYQSELGEQLRELSCSQEPLSCHQLCEVVMRKVRGLELLVRRNTKEHKMVILSNCSASASSLPKCSNPCNTVYQNHGSILTVISLSVDSLLLVGAKSLRTPSNMFVVNLALCDFAMMLKTPIFIYNSFNLGFATGHMGCQIFATIGSFSGIGAAATNAIISYDRYRTIARPFDGKISRGKAFLFILLIWAYVSPWVIMPMTGYWGRFVPEGYLTSCSFDYLTKSKEIQIFVSIMFVICYVLPMSMIIYFYSQIVSHVVNHEKTLREQAKKMNVESLRSNTNQQNQSAEIRIAKAAITICFLFVASWTPYAVLALIGAYGDQSLLTPGVTMIPACTCKFVACLDPYVYAISHPRYRLELAKRIPWLAIKETAPSETSSNVTESTATTPHE